MIKDKTKIVNEPIKDGALVNPIINNRAGGNALWSPKGSLIGSIQKNSKVCFDTRQRGT